ncbi:MAG: isopentenyl-diphosphate Delta-isomerase [Crocinitomicaceae bacterium]
MEYVVLVNEKDEEVGTMEKLEAHEKGVLHRAFSVFLFNSKGEMLLQQRASSKYHSPNLWTNTCCSHPRPNESIKNAANRRLNEEMGMSCDLKRAFHFTYNVKLDQGLTEHELDHVFLGITDSKPIINREEVRAYQYLPIKQIQQQMAEEPDQFTEWFKICFKEVLKHYES